MYEKLSRLFELPQESVSSVPIFEIKGKNEVSVSGCTGILEYSEDRIVLALADGALEVLGKYLLLCDFRDGELSVRGEIASAAFVNRDGGEKCSKG